jgi:hypothetical protein
MEKGESICIYIHKYSTRDREGEREGRRGSVRDRRGGSERCSRSCDGGVRSMAA